MRFFWNNRGFRERKSPHPIMIVSFSVANYRSISDEQTLSFVASKRFHDSHGNHAESIPDSDEKVLRVGVLYGANGAGKSNVFKALEYVERMVLKPRAKDTGTLREPFRLKNDDKKRPSSFDLRFIVTGKLYRFGFVVDDDQVVEEWLVRAKGEREVILYERTIGDGGRPVIRAPEFKKTSDRLAALSTIGGPSNQTFLGFIGATLDASDCGEEIRAILVWFRESLGLISPIGRYPLLNDLLARDEEFRHFAGDFLKGASTGVDGLVASRKEVTEAELRRMLPEAIVTEILNSTEKGNTSLFNIPLGFDMIVERSEEDHYYMLIIQAKHENESGLPVPFSLSEESDGTQRLLDLLPALYYLRGNEMVYFVDEIDRSMHPLLVWKFVECFLSSCVGSRSQIILTTHESNLLDLDLLRRDEIWFAEKNPAGATTLFSLADFQIRKDLEIRKHYLQGRFGAIPFLGSLDRLIGRHESVTEEHAIAT
jgi:AAA15 family ATPase/GTPase